MNDEDSSPDILNQKPKVLYMGREIPRLTLRFALGFGSE